MLLIGAIPSFGDPDDPIVYTTRPVHKHAAHAFVVVEGEGFDDGTGIFYREFRLPVGNEMTPSSGMWRSTSFIGVSQNCMEDEAE